MRTRYKIVDKQYPHFITSTIVNFLQVFSSELYCDIMMNNFAFYQSKYNMEVIAYVLMPNHFHMICNCSNLKLAIQSLKSYSAKKILERLNMDSNERFLKELRIAKSSYKKESNYQVWQESYHPQLIKDYKMLKQKIDYIHYNPVKKNLVENPEDWKYSSARFYFKEEDCGLKITPYF